MKIDLTSPVELWKCEMPTREYPACALKLYNLSDQLMVSVEVTLLLLDENGEEQARVLFREHDLHGEPGKTFRMTVPVELGSKMPAACEVVFEKAWYEDGTAWRRSRGHMLTFRSNVLPKGRDLDKLQLVAGETAAGYPEEQENGWLCVCGRPNPLDAEECIRCHRRHDEVFERFGREAVDKEVDVRQAHMKARTRKALEDASRRQLALEARDERRRKTRNRLIAAVVAAAVLCGTGYVGVFKVKPYLEYMSAMKAYEKGSWLEAADAFAAMPGYRDADDYQLRSRYNMGKDMLQSTDLDTLRAAEQYLQELGEFEDCAELAVQARARQADVLLELGRVQDARELYVMLDDEAEITRCDYLAACELLEQGDFAAAMTSFEALGDYDDAPDKLTEATLGRAGAMLAGNADDPDMPDAVLALLENVPDADAATLRSQAWYRKGMNLHTAGNDEEAGDAFLMAGDYQDAAQQAVECLYAPACAAQEAGNLVEAASLFDKLRTLGHPEAEERWMQCTYGMAHAAMDDLEYKLAAQLLAQLPADYEDCAELRRECDYRIAVNAMNKGEYAEAAAAFEQLGDYSDSPALYLSARYAMAGALAEHEPAAAMAIYEELGEYEDSAEQLNALHYAEAERMLTEGREDEAMALFDSLGAYSNSAERANAIRYQQAEALYADGHVQEAIQAFRVLNGYSDSDERANRITYDQADLLRVGGDLDESAALFLSLGEYEDSAEQVRSIRYDQACALLDAHEYPAARQLFSDLGDYRDAAARARDCDLLYADWLLETGDTEAAEAMYLSLGEMGEQAEGLKSIYYAQAVEAESDGDLEAAYTLYQKAAGYQDAEARADACMRVFSVPYEQAMNAMEQGDAAGALAVLSEVNVAALPDRYEPMLVLYAEAADQESERLLENGDTAAVLALLSNVPDKVTARMTGYGTAMARVYIQDAEKLLDEGSTLDAIELMEQVPAVAVEAMPAAIDETYARACLTEANRLFDEGRDADALPYILRIRTPEALALLGRYDAWLILGSWTDGETTYVFRPDGTCTLNGENLCYRLDGYFLMTGPDMDSLALTHKIAAAPSTVLFIRDVRNEGDRSLTLNWVKELPAAEAE